MSAIKDYMTTNHRHCDDLFSTAEEALAAKQWDQLPSAWTDFQEELKRHLSMEEEVLFPAFEAKTGMTSGPTAVMRAEHEQMRSLVEEMGAAVSAKASERFAGLAETLMILMQQHNMKEEQILYPMTDQVLTEPEVVLESMQQI